MAYIDSLFSTLGLKSFRLWRILAIFFALLNLKQLPFVWHVCTQLEPPFSQRTFH